MTDPRTPANTGRGVILTPASSGKKNRFAKVKKTPASQRSDDKTQQKVIVVLVKPDAQSETSVYGMTITPLGFMMDRFLSDVFYKKVPDVVTKNFLEKTGCVHRSLEVLDETGAVFKKENKGKFYPVKSAFIPVDDPDDLDSEQFVTQTINTLCNELWGAIDKETFSYAKESDLPRILDWNRDVRTVTNYSDIMHKPEDIIMCMNFTCMKNDCQFSDWVKMPEDNNIYTMFKTGKVPPQMVAKWSLPFDRLARADKNAYRAWKEENDRKLAAATNKPEAVRNLGNEFDDDGDITE